MCELLARKARCSPSGTAGYWILLVLAAVSYGGGIWTSTNGGTTWVNSTAGTSASGQGWVSITISSDGTKLAAAVGYGGDIWTSTNGGATWVDRSSAGTRDWHTIASSSNGNILVVGDFGTVGVSGGQIYVSTNGGSTWSAQNSAGSQSWTSVASSDDGSRLAATVNSGYAPGYIYTAQK